MSAQQLPATDSQPRCTRAFCPMRIGRLSAKTTSAGEAIAIAFRGNPNTRSFGQRTRGLTTAHSTFTLSDGAMIVLTKAIDTDRNGQVYEDGVTPDVLTEVVEDEVPSAACRWLLDQPACRQ